MSRNTLIYIIIYKQMENQIKVYKPLYFIEVDR